MPKSYERALNTAIQGSVLVFILTLLLGCGNKAYLSVVADPSWAGAKVRLDGRMSGTVSSAGGVFAGRVPNGQHTIELVLEGHVPATLILDTEEGEIYGHVEELPRPVSPDRVETR